MLLVPLFLRGRCYRRSANEDILSVAIGELDLSQTDAQGRIPSAPESAGRENGEGFEDTLGNERADPSIFEKEEGTGEILGLAALGIRHGYGADHAADDADLLAEEFIGPEGGHCDARNHHRFGVV
jgi:hypothetical protein